MAQKSKSKKRNPSSKSKSSQRAIWKGSIDFGLVNIPVRLYAAEAASRLSFDLLDKRDFSRIRYRRVNEKSGREVPWDKIVKGYPYENGEYVALSDEDFRRANVEATQTIDITDFVDGAEISPIYYDKPYYLEPLKSGRRSYALLREAMRTTGKVGVAKVVIRSRQHLAVLLAHGPLLVLDLMRFAYELRDPARLDLSAGGGKNNSVSKQEIEMAKRLVETMISAWNPKKYHDDYRDDLLKVINKKIKAGKTKSVESQGTKPPARRRGKVIDIMHLLRRSVEQAGKKEEGSRHRKAG